MSGYFAPEAAWWRSTRERLPKPWAREDALIDLRWWQDQVLVGAERRIPSRAQLAEHWGWTDKRVRLLLAAEEEWSDPNKAERWAAHQRASRGPAEGQPRASRGPTRGQNDEPLVDVETTERASRGPAEGQPRANQGPTEGHTRRDPPTPTPTPTQAPVKTVRERKPKPPPATGPEVEARKCWQAAWQGRPLYGWAPRQDARDLADIAAAAGLDDPQPDRIDRLTRAARLYIAEADAQRAFPPGPPTLRGLRIGVAEWLQRADGPQLRGKHAHDPPREEARPPPITEAEVARELALWAEEDAAREREAARRRRVG